ncbi:helix-turn-helix domain-containing protein [Thermodesulfobacteriota bacterium]
MKYDLIEGGRRLKCMRGSKGLSIRELSKFSGINENNLGKYEKGMHRPNIETAAIICKALGCEISDIWPVALLKNDEVEE